MAPRRHPLTPAQRSAKIEGDRRRRREHNMEFRRLQNEVRELQGLVVTQRNEITSLREDNERFNDMVPNLQNTIHELHELNRELYQKNLELNMSLENSFFDIDQYLIPNEEAANNDLVTDGAGTSQTGRGFGEFEEPNSREEDERQRKGKSIQKFDN